MILTYRVVSLNSCLTDLLITSIIFYMLNGIENVDLNQMYFYLNLYICQDVSVCISFSVFIFDKFLQFTSKQLERLAKKAEKEQKVQQAKVKKVGLFILVGSTVEPLLYDHPQNHIGVVV